MRFSRVGVSMGRNAAKRAKKIDPQGIYFPPRAVLIHCTAPCFQLSGKVQDSIPSPLIIPDMGWIKDALEAQKKKTPAATPAPSRPVSQTSQATELWNKIKKSIERDVLEFNAAGGRIFVVSNSGPEIIHVLPTQPLANTLTLQFQNGIVQLTCTISGPGVPRLATFAIKDGKAVFSGRLTGGPAPRRAPMDAEEFSEEVLKPFLFPEL